jgi:hypothetical protein
MHKPIIDIKVENLEFDYENPRLVENPDARGNPEEIIRFLTNEYDLQELIDSILSNGYLNFEPIIVMQHNQHYRVLEGNRRLAAIKLLQDRNLARSFKIKSPDETPQFVLDSFVEIPAIEVESEDEARSYIGFKHINGSNKWNSFAKAKYVTKWFLDGCSIPEIAGKVGDTNQTVRNLIGGMLVLNQAEDSDLFQIDERTKPGPFGFSHLYTALNRAEFKEFLNLDVNWSQNPVENPVPTKNAEQLKSMLQYIYGSKRDGIKSVIRSQNPDLKHLGAVVVNPVAYKKLQQTNDLDIALEETKEKGLLFEDNIVAASIALEKAMRTLSGYKEPNSRIIDICEEIQTNADFINFQVQKKKNVQ